MSAAEMYFSSQLGTLMVLWAQFVGALTSEHRIQLVVQHDGQVQLQHLVVLHCEVMAGALYVSPLVDGRGQALSLSETIGNIATSEIFFLRLN